MPEHRIKFVQLVHAPRDLFNRDAEFVCQFALLCVVGRQKFVQRRIEKADRSGQPL